MSKNDVVSRFPAERNLYNPTEVLRVTIPPSVSFPAFSEGRLEADITLEATGATPVFDQYSGAFSMIKTLTIYLDGVVVEQIQNLNLLLHQFFKLSYDEQSGTAQLRDLMSGSGIEGSVSQKFVLPLGFLSGLFAKGSTIPLQLTTSGMMLEMELDTAAKVVYKEDAGDTITASNYTVANAAIVLPSKAIPQEEAEALTQALHDKHQGEGVVLNWTTYASDLSTAGVDQRRVIVTYQGAASHDDCLSLWTFPCFTDNWGDVNQADKFKSEKNNCIDYQFNLDNQNVPSRPVVVSKDWNSLNVTEIELACVACQKPVTNMSSLYDPSQLIIGRALAPKGHSLNLANKQCQLVMNNSASSIGVTLFSYVAFVRTLVLKQGQIRVVEGLDSAIARQ